MPVKAGQIVINLTLAQAQFMEKLVTAKAAVKDFSASGGRSFKEFGDTGGAAMKQLAGHSVSSVQATSGTLRDLEGHFGNNMRAAERFIATTLGLGPVLQKAFPLIGGLAFGGMIVDLSTKVYTFFKDIQEAPAKMQAAFRQLQAPLDLTNDELDLANARLQSSIDKLEGKPENGLAIALAEAKVAADKLADSLERDLEALDKVLKDQELSAMKSLMSTNLSKGDIPGVDESPAIAALERVLGGERGLGGIEAQVRAIRDDEAKQLEALKAGGRLVGGAAGLAFDSPSSIPGYVPGQIHVQGRQPGQYAPGQISLGDLGQPLPLKGADTIRHAADEAIEKLCKNVADGIAGVLASPNLGQADKDALVRAQDYILGQIRKVAGNEKNTDLTERNNADRAKSAPPEAVNTDALWRRSQEETNRLLQELATATEKNLSVWDAINLKQQEMLREAARANTAEGFVGPAVIPQVQVDLIQQITDAARLTASTKALEEFNRAMIDMEGEWDKLQGKRNEETVKLLFPKIDMKPYEEQERFDNVQSSADREALTRQAGFADRMSEIGGGSQEDKINLGYERRIELANQLKAVEQTRIDAELDLETKVHLMQEQQIASDKAIAEAEDERALKLAQVQQQRIKELTDPIINGLSEQLANAMTGKKTSFGKTAENAGHQMLEGSLNKLLHYGASKLKLGKPDGSKGNAYHVIVDGGAGDGAAAAAGDSDGSAATASTGNSGILEKLVSKLLGRRDPYAPTTGGWTGVVGPPVLSDGGADAGSDLPDLDTFDPPFLAHAAGAASALGGAFGHLPELTASGMSTLLGLFSAVGGGGGGVPSVSSSIDYGGPMAGGGPVLPGVSYGIHDGTDELFIPGSPGNIVPVSKMGGGQTININHNVDARGAELGAANRMARALEATHASAVRNATHAMSEHQKRTVQRR